MIVLTSGLSLRLAALSAALSVLSMLCVAQSTPAPSKTAVPSNPRAGSDDPRIGLKPGLYDAGEAAFGMERLASLPKPTGFAPGDFFAAPTPPPEPPPAGEPARPPTVQYGSTNSDLAFSGNHLFVGNYNGINTYDIDNPGKVKLRASLVCPAVRETSPCMAICSSCRQRR